MPTAQDYRAQAAAYAARAKAAQSPSECREFRTLEHNFTSLAANEEWLAGDDGQAAAASVKTDHAPAEEEQILRCLGAAVIMRWNTLPRKIRRELFDHASSIGDLLHTPELKEQIARVSAGGKFNESPNPRSQP